MIGNLRNMANDMGGEVNTQPSLLYTILFRCKSRTSSSTGSTRRPSRTRWGWRWPTTKPKPSWSNLLFPQLSCDTQYIPCIISKLVDPFIHEWIDQQNYNLKASTQYLREILSEEAGRIICNSFSASNADAKVDLSGWKKQINEFLHWL